MGRLSKADIDEGVKHSAKLDADTVARYKELRRILDDMGYGYGWDVKLAATIALTEHGYTASGISSAIVNGADLDRAAPSLQSTVQNWFDKAEEEFDTRVLFAHPQQNPVDELWPDEYDNPYQ